LAALATEAARAAGAKHPEVFARLLTSSSAVTYDDAGLPTNLRALIADIRKESPGFFQPNPHGNADGGARPLAPPPPEDPSRQVDTVIRNAVRRARWADFV